VKNVLEAMDALDVLSIEKIIESIPVEVMNPVYKEWVKRLLLNRKQWLLNWYKGGADNG